MKLPKNPDQRFIEGLKSGDAKVLQEIYSLIWPKVRGFVQQNQGSEAQAKDVFQKALLQLSARTQVRSFELKSSFEGYLFTACKNLWRRELKKDQLRGVTSERVRKLYYEPEDMAASVLEQERWELFQTKLAELSANCRQLLEMLFAKQSGREIMEKMGYGSEGTVRQRIFKCKTRLSKLVMNDPRYKGLLFK